KGYYPRFNELTERLGESLARTLSQTTVFKARPIVSFLHAFIFYGFTFYVLVNLFDVLEGYLPPSWTQAMHFGVLGDLYRLGADIFTVLVIIGVVFFMVRRFLADDRRLHFNDNTPLHEKVRAGSIRRDSLIVGTFILVHVGFRLAGATYLVAAGGEPDLWQPTANALAGLVGYGPNRMIGWHVGFWGALGAILVFLPYFPRSKHIHLFGAPAKFTIERRYDDLGKIPSGVLEPIDFEDEALEQYGVAKLEHFRATQILDGYACIQCNRCTNVCPAQQTGKALSPGAMEINKRYELNTVAPLLAAGEESPREVMTFMLDEESLWACTACGACMEICPTGCEQMIDIIDIRRDQVMMKGEFPAELQAAFRGMERAGNPWGISQDERTAWTEGLNVPTTSDNPDFEVLYWVGCAGSYDPAAQKTTRAFARILEHAGINYAILGKGEKCTGDPARRAGNEYLYYQLATENVLTLNEALIDDTFDRTKKKRVVTACPHCFNALFNDYPQLGGEYEVTHHTQLIDELMQAGRLPPLDLTGAITYHDPCYLGRHNGIYDAPRHVLQRSGLQLEEMPRNRNRSFCCGAGGAQFWKEEEPGKERVSENRFREAAATGAATVATACPFCKVMLSSSESAQQQGAPDVRDIAQIVADNLERIEERLGAAAR
ncbi:MAG TPA: (Fe-S)-binding protein, partial [Trueperaceae bacterium]